VRQCGGLGAVLRRALRRAFGERRQRSARGGIPPTRRPTAHDPADPSSRTPRPHRIRVPLPVASADNLNFLLLAKHTLHTQAKQANQHHDIHTLRTDAQTGEKHPTHTRQGP